MTSRPISATCRSSLTPAIWRISTTASPAPASAVIRCLAGAAPGGRNRSEQFGPSSAPRKPNATASLWQGGGSDQRRRHHNLADSARRGGRLRASAYGEEEHEEAMVFTTRGKMGATAGATRG